MAVVVVVAAAVGRRRRRRTVIGTITVTVNQLGALLYKEAIMTFYHLNILKFKLLLF